MNSPDPDPVLPGQESVWKQFSEDRIIGILKVSDVKRLQAVEEENARLKRLLA